MAYTKHTWKERLGTGLNKFKDTVTGTIMALVNQPDSVTQEGTPLRADWLNDMEDGIYQAHQTADGLVAGTIKAGDAAKLDGAEQSYINTFGNIVRRSTIDGNIVVGPIYEDGALLSNKYLGITAQAADSALLNGREASYTPISGGVVRWSQSAVGNFYIQAKRFIEDGTQLELKYAPKTTYGTGAPPATGTPGSIYIQY